MASVRRKISRTCSPCRAQSCSSGHLVLVKELAKGWGLGWESHSHYPCHCEKCLLSLRGFQKCVFRPVCYSYHSCGPAKSKASSGAERRDEQLDWSVCRAQLEQAGWRGSSAHSSADAHTHTYTRTRSHTSLSGSSAVHEAGPVGQNDPSYPNMIHHNKDIFNTMTPKTDMLALTQ